MIEAHLVPSTEDDLGWTPRSAQAESMRASMLRIVGAAIDAAAPGPLVTRALAEQPIASQRVLIVAAGKAALPMTGAALDAMRGSSVAGLVVAPQPMGTAAAGEPAVQPLELLYGGHPLPNASSAAAGARVAALASDAGPSDVVLLLLSGGASALLALPAGDLSIEDYAATTSLLLRAGADIQQLNTVRRHIDALKGGRLAALAQPAAIHALILSDVIGDELDAIASGPVSPDATTYADALAAIHSLRAWAGTPERVRRHLERGAAGEYDETLKAGDAAFDSVRTRIIGNNSLALRGAADAARAAGYTPVVIDEPVTGVARDAGQRWGERVRSRVAQRSDERIALIAGGETIVHVKGEGRGGRNQELVLAAAVEIAGIPNVLVASIGTDGIDGTTSVAGATADGDSVRIAADRGLDPQRYLDDNDAFGFFGSLHDLILTGSTGTNVLDVQIALIDPR